MKTKPHFPKIVKNEFKQKESKNRINLTFK
jgi:hypothetical protein